MPSLTPCCGASVGAIPRRGDDILLLTRAWYPDGVAPPAGHDDHDGDSLAAEVAEETGLTVTWRRPLAERLWLPGLCASPPAIPLPGHWWRLEEIGVTGDLAPDPIETRGARWYSPREIEDLVQVTMALATGTITDAVRTTR
ncbi:MAG TPA: NUDIX hydrolase [Thermobifida alba]|nr:NUDIX hydrolase [Thermobifida alba]